MIYLFISGLVLLGIFFCLRAFHLETIAISFFVGLGRVITLRTMLVSWTVSAKNLGSEYESFIWTILVMSDYYFFFLLLSLAPIGLYAALTLVPKHVPDTDLSSRYLLGFSLIGVGGYFTWMEVEKFGTRYIWGVNTWTSGIYGGVMVLIVGIGLSVLGFWATRPRRGG